MLDHVHCVHPDHVQAIIQPAFETVVENSSFNVGTALLDMFQAYGADVSNPTLFWKATQELELGPTHKALELQAIPVLRSLIRAGADPAAEIDDMLTYQSTGVQAMARAVQRALEEVEVERGLETNTAPILGASSCRQKRL